MYEGLPRDRAETEYRRRHESPIIRRPDRIALWAVGMAIVAMIAAAASAHAGSGGTGATGGGGGSRATVGGAAPGGSCADSTFGSRSLRLGDCGEDVKTLHWIMKADSYGVSLDKQFDDSTQGEVQDFQRSHDLRRSGVVAKSTRKQLVKTMPKSGATWY